MCEEDIEREINGTVQARALTGSVDLMEPRSSRSFSGKAKGIPCLSLNCLTKKHMISDWTIDHSMSWSTKRSAADRWE
jgi:hypothetical protein